MSICPLCPYVLASLDSTIDANRSTAHGVVGSAVEAARILLGGHKGKINSVDFSHSIDNYLLTAGGDR